MVAAVERVLKEKGIANWKRPRLEENGQKFPYALDAIYTCRYL